MKCLSTLFLLLVFSVACLADDPPEDEEMKKLREELTKLQDERKRLDDLLRLKEEIARLKLENKRLKDEFSGMKPPPPPAPVKPTLPIPQEKWDFGNLSVALPLKVSSVKLRGYDQAAITMEFTQTMEPKDVVLLDKVIRSDPSLFLFWYVDREGVALHSDSRFLVEGDITGRKGDAFRLLLRLPDANVLERVNKVELRRGL